MEGPRDYLDPFIENHLGSFDQGLRLRCIWQAFHRTMGQKPPRWGIMTPLGAEAQIPCTKQALIISHFSMIKPNKNIKSYIENTLYVV
jgi:hypothetical protein